MTKRTLAVAVLGVIAFCFGGALVLAQGGETQERGLVSLPEPQTEGGRPLMQVLKDRKSTRSVSSRPLPEQELSNLLWAAWGVNRPESGKRTAPSAVNWQEIDIYVAKADGLYLFDANAHALKLVNPDDVRDLTGRQGFVSTAPLNLVYVADYARMGRGSQNDKDFYSAADTGFISQNVYLYCASEGLATVVRAMIPRDRLAEAMDLRPEQKIILAQTVGYPR
ncbi:MAG: SagB/ThcOx family dehydrogenase [Candidatus Brocadiia bacterium]